MMDQAFDYIFDTCKFNKNQVVWNVLSNGDDSKSEICHGDVFESSFNIKMVDKEAFRIRVNKNH